MHSARDLGAWAPLALSLALSTVSCTDTNNPAADAGATDLGTGPTDADVPCRGPEQCPTADVWGFSVQYQCEPSVRRCVECYVDEHCPLFRSPVDRVHGTRAGDGGVPRFCVSLSCQECRADQDCPRLADDAGLTVWQLRCDRAQRCVACLRDEHCAAGERCADGGCVGAATDAGLDAAPRD